MSADKEKLLEALGLNKDATALEIIQATNKVLGVKDKPSSEPYNRIGVSKGYDVYMQVNKAGGRTYISSELGQTILDTSIHDIDQLLFVIAYEKELQFTDVMGR